MTNLDSILKSRDITLPTKVHLVKAMVFPVVMYGCRAVPVVAHPAGEPVEPGGLPGPPAEAYALHGAVEHIASSDLHTLSPLWSCSLINRLSPSSSDTVYHAAEKK